jgi:ERCC4-related helicase
MEITLYHAKYYAYELTRRSVANSPERIAPILAGAKVDLNPHQIEAALFAVRSPFSQGSLLADEVGLGKTIEAGLLIAQKWAELQRKIIIIVPASLRKQWNQELLEKFYIPSIILDGKTFQEYIDQGNNNPFDQNGKIIICSYHFAYNKADFINPINWDLAVIDEAHRLRNVYKKDNKIAKSIKETLGKTTKILLTATPLQNSLLELYGLVSFIDEYRFGDLKSFKGQYSHITSDDTYQELRERLKPVCQRTLRRQVLEYIKYTNRHSITQQFIPTPEEQQLHDWIVEYLQRDKLYAFSESARHLITLVLLKLLASSTLAIAGTLDGVTSRLEAEINGAKVTDEELQQHIANDFEEFEDVKEEWNAQNNDNNEWTQIDLNSAKQELEELKKYRDFAYSIKSNAKAESLVPALKAGFEKTQSLGAKKKAVIFTESRRTQKYLLELLSSGEYLDKVILFNGSNDDVKSNQIYHDWLEIHQGTDNITGSKQADKRAAIAEYFRDSAEILIATEAAAEGINLQFCSLVVNYDLPWNPQRVEQRIGRCHRYGQKYDVVVVNFLNKQNLADLRIFELLDEKFKLFDGVFGASDEILGSIESGIDLEKRVVQIYRQCRTTEEIEHAFDQLQLELEEQINTKMQSTRKNLLEHFDEEVHEKLKMNLSQAREYVSKFEEWLWQVTFSSLREKADFDFDQHVFWIKHNPFPELNIPEGKYQMNKFSNDGHTYHLQHLLAQAILKQVKSQDLKPAKIVFGYTNQPKKISILEPLINHRGFIMLSKLTIKAVEDEDHLLFVGQTQEGEKLTPEQCMRIFSLAGRITQTPDEPVSHQQHSLMREDTEAEQQKILVEISERNAEFFEQEIDKLDNWADDKRNSLKFKLKELDDRIKDLKKQSRLAPNLPAKLNMQKKIRELEARRDKAWSEFDIESKKVDQEKDRLIDTIEARLKQSVQLETLFAIQWEIV